MPTPDRPDASVACTAAVHALDRRLRAEEARRAPLVLALRAAYEGAAGVPTLGSWRRLAGLVLDGGWWGRPGIEDRLCVLAARAVARARTTAALLAASAAHRASLACWEARGGRGR